MGTPLDVPVPRKISRRVRAESRSVNRPVLPQGAQWWLQRDRSRDMRILMIPKLTIMFRAKTLPKDDSSPHPSS